MAGAGQIAHLGREIELAICPDRPGQNAIPMSLELQERIMSLSDAIRFILAEIKEMVERGTGE
jgi:hypothetical protein